MPNSDRLARRLDPSRLERIIRRRGLEDCADLVARISPDQLAAIFDIDLWRSARPGTDDTLDADRFGLWVAALVEAGAGTAANALMGVEVELVIAGLARTRDSNATGCTT